MTVLKSVVNSVSTGVDAEISVLRDDAHLRIHEREVARAYINEYVHTMPLLVGGQHIVGYTNERGDKMSKQQYRNQSLWVVTLQTVIERGNTSYAHLGAMFASWAKDTLGVEWHIDAAKRTAKLFVNSLQDQGTLSSKYSDFEYVDDNNMPAIARVFELHTDFKPVYDALFKKLCTNAHYVCRPLYNLPNDWVNNFSGIGERAGLQLVKGLRTSYVAQSVLDAVNKLQRVTFTVPECMIDAAHDLLDNQHELPSTAEELMLYQEIVKYANTNFHFPVTMDSRGRMYYRGGLLSPQGTDYCKAAFQFATPERLGETGLRAVTVHLANQLGYDKLSMIERESAVAAHLDAGDFDSIEDFTDVQRVFPQIASKPFQALVAILDLKRILLDIEAGSAPADCWSALVCHQDGTCNGLQHMAAITHNRQTAETVNCTGAGHDDAPRDIYGIIATAALKFVQTDGARVLIEKYARDMAKNPVMITGYGAGEDTIKSNIAQYLADKGEANLFASDIGDAYIAAITANAGAVKALTAAIKARVSKAVEDGATGFKWETADGFKCDISYKDYEPARIRAGVFNALLRTNECAMDEVKTLGAMSPNFIHSIDATHLRMVVNECDWDLVTVHDSIGSRPCDYFATNVIIREQFAKVHEYDAIRNLCENMGARVPKFRGDYDAIEALESTYIFS